MRVLNRMMRMFVSISLFIIISLNSFSQKTINDAIASYNGGLMAQQSGSLEAAIDSFKMCISIAKELGEEAEDVRIQAESQIPKMYYEIGKNLASEKKYDKAIEKFLETIDIAKVYGTDDDVKKVTAALGQVYYFQGTVLYKQDNFTEALGFFNKSIEIIPDNSKAYYLIALCYKNLDDEANLIGAANKSAEVAKAENDNKMFDSSMKLGRDYFLVKANDAKVAKKFDEAIKYLNTSIEFDSENATTYFLLTQIYNTQQMWDDAINAANKALEFENNNPADQAKIYYEIGNAMAAKGENEKACDAFKKAAVGPFKASADYQVEHVLKCE